MGWTNCNVLSSEFCAVINTTVHAFSSRTHRSSVLQSQSLQDGRSHSSNPRVRNLVQQENCPRHFTCGLHRWSIFPLINITCLTVNSAHCNRCILHHRSHDKRGLCLYVKSISLYLTLPPDVMHYLVTIPYLFPTGCLVSFSNRHYWIAYTMLLFFETRE